MDNAGITIPIQELERRFRSVIVRLPAIVGNEAVNFFLDSFRNQSFAGNSMQIWPSRKDPNKWGKVKRPGRALLINTGRLRRSIRVVRSSFDSVTIGTDVPYAKAQNEGFKGTVVQSVKGYQRNVFGKVKSSSGRTKKGIVGSQTVSPHQRTIKQNIPKRQFMGNSPYLNARIKRICEAEILKVLRP